MSFCMIKEEVQHREVFEKVDEMLEEEFPRAPMVLAYVGAEKAEDPPRMGIWADGASGDIRREGRRGIIHMALVMADLFNQMYDREEQANPGTMTSERLPRELLAVTILLKAAEVLSRDLRGGEKK